MQTYRCTKNCPINKHCFVIKTKEKLKEEVVVLVKCVNEKGKDIEIKIGESPP